MKKTLQKVQKWMHDKQFKKAAEERQAAGGKNVTNLDLKGKKAVVFGVATDKSIAWAIAKKLNDQGCRVALAYQDRVGEYVKELAKELDDPVLGVCDVMDDELLQKFYDQIKNEFGTFDYLVHSIAFAKKEFLEGKFFEVDRKGYNTAQQVSAYSLPLLLKKFVDIMNEGGSVMTMTYYGGVKAIPNYNVMGVCKAALEACIRYLAVDVGDKQIRVNGISAGPIKTLAASGVGGFDKILGIVEEKSPLKRNITTDEVAKGALFLLSDMSSGVTGHVLYIDAGYNIMGM